MITSAGTVKPEDWTLISLDFYLNMLVFVILLGRFVFWVAKVRRGLFVQGHQR